MDCRIALWLLYALYCVSSLPSDCASSKAALRKRFPKRSHSRDLAEARKFLSLPDLNVLGEGRGIPTHKAISTWATSIREAGQASGSQKGAFGIDETDVKSQTSDLQSHGTQHNNVKTRRNRPNPWQRLMALPLWQTSLLSCKHVQVHSNDEVTYRERTFPTARSNSDLCINLRKVVRPPPSDDEYGGQTTRSVFNARLHTEICVDDSFRAGATPRPTGSAFSGPCIAGARTH
jgi:hypothetical protein